jgi:hypothetical protein
MGGLLDALHAIRQLLSEAASLRTVQGEVNPLKQRGDNPIKKLVRDFRKARRTRKPKDISIARASHRVGAMYAHHHGLPRLEKQIERHQARIPNPLKKKAERKPFPRKRSRGSAIRDLGKK